MDILAELSAGHSRAITTRIVNYIGSDKVRFAVLMKIFTGDDLRLQQRSAWAMSDIVVKHPQLIKPFLKNIIPRLRQSGHPAIARNILRILQFIDLPEKYESVVFDDCLRFIKSESTPVAIRAFAVTVAGHICNKYPELQRELRPVLRELMTLQQQPAMSHRIKLVLKAWERGTQD